LDPSDATSEHPTVRDLAAREGSFGAASRHREFAGSSCWTCGYRSRFY